MKDIVYYDDAGTITAVETVGIEWLDAARYGLEGRDNLYFQQLRKANGTLADSLMTGVERKSEDEVIDALAETRGKPFLLAARADHPPGKPEAWKVIGGKLVAA